MVIYEWKNALELVGERFADGTGDGNSFDIDSQVFFG